MRSCVATILMGPESPSSQKTSSALPVWSLFISKIKEKMCIRDRFPAQVCQILPQKKEYVTDRLGILPEKCKKSFLFYPAQKGKGGKAVSYTHLDVYKRQVFPSTIAAIKYPVKVTPAAVVSTAFTGKQG